ncbi:zinc ribbon domain-containing protein [Natrinema longum]|uniref:Zinc ribbon domain-containing protein n=1 Tax=Natrinema longum TaxID=370324 RepID=A0A8A2U5J3_9EURY|nr:zinc ribbon domain-containing protein [Natrinema longum]MBZ6494733.1 zinc ribbon domain-containing protein [Natrinema longum]QSW83957.1 zinc ribbon domain-containing protein [Natrinema longum]
MTWLRALLAAGLSVIMPGAGHVLVRDWLRAALFAGLFLSVSAFFLPIDQLTAAGPITSYDEAFEQATIMAEETDVMAQFFLSFIALFAAVDSAFRALGYLPGGNTETDESTCPECGKEIDEDLAFCHWCTTRLEPAEPEAETNDI